MKITLPSNTTIFIREEDFVEVNVGPEEVSYIRPNGTKAIIKLQPMPPNSNINSGTPMPEALKRSEQTANLKERNAGSKLNWRKEPSTKQEDSSCVTINEIDELRKKIEELSTSFKTKLDAMENSIPNIVLSHSKYEELKSTITQKSQADLEAFKTIYEADKNKLSNQTAFLFENLNKWKGIFKDAITKLNQGITLTPENTGTKSTPI